MGILLYVLIVEDSEEDTLLLLETLRRGGYEPEFERVDTAEAMSAALGRQSWDIILSDYSMPGFDAPAALRLAKSIEIDIPFIVVSGAIGEETAVALMREGAHDYVLKSNLARLNPAVERQLQESRRRREQMQVDNIITYLADHDTLTNLPNRFLFTDRLQQAIRRAPWRKRRVAVVFLDLDGFKGINDTLGHAVGDQLLKVVAERLRSAVREGDTVARFGGDEFVLILDDLAAPEDVPRIARKILREVSEPNHIGRHALFVTASIGIALYPDDGQDADSLLINADAAMYGAKEKGKNDFQLYSPILNDKASGKIVLENGLRRALERGEFRLHYQPKIDLATGEIVGTEALIRWDHPELGLISPSEFIPLADETGLIVPIGEWVLRTACAQNKAWQQAGLASLPVAVNFSGRQFQQQNLIEKISQTIEETTLDPKYLELELTEGVIMKEGEATAETLRTLDAMGIKISVDGFGTGYSSLSHLKRLPVSSLKIDRVLTRNIAIVPDDAVIVEAIIQLGHRLKLKVIAEAVEDQDQLEFLRSLKCDQMQGYYLSKPLPAGEIERVFDLGPLGITH